MNNKQEEIKLAIESKAKELSGLMEEYDNNGGKPVFLLMTRFDDAGTHNISAYGTGEDIKNLMFSNEEIATLATGGTLENLLNDPSIEVETDEK